MDFKGRSRKRWINNLEVSVWNRDSTLTELKRDKLTTCIWTQGGGGTSQMRIFGGQVQNVLQPWSRVYSTPITPGESDGNNGQMDVLAVYWLNGSLEGGVSLGAVEAEWE